MEVGSRGWRVFGEERVRTEVHGPTKPPLPTIAGVVEVVASHGLVFAMSSSDSRMKTSGCPGNNLELSGFSIGLPHSWAA